ncbi:MAG: protein kinase, partial [Myxococcales bacterium]|nr:protein kinase [Myxococcales bacterium]
RRAGRHMSASDLRATFEPILDALAFAHARGVLHRDIKPSNIVLARAPSGALEPKLVDFGTARVQAAAFHTSAGNTGFTPLYGAPEQWEPSLGAPSPATDVYSLGLTILEAATLERPHAQADGLPAIMRAALGGTGHPSLSRSRADLGLGLDAFARRATAVSPSARFQSGAEMKAAFVTSLGAASPHAVTGLPPAGGALGPAPAPLAPLPPAIGHTTGAPLVSAPHTRPQPASHAVSFVAIAIAAVAVVVALAGGGAALYLARSGPSTTVVLSPGGGGATPPATAAPPKKAARGLSAPLVRPTSEFDQANAAEVAQRGQPALVACAEKSRRFSGTVDLTLEVDRAGKVIGTDCHTVWPRHDSKNPPLDPAATEFCACAQTVTPKWRFAPPKPEDVPEGTPGVPKGMVAALTDSCTLRVRYTSVE